MISAALHRQRIALEVAEEGEPLYSKRLPLTLPSRSNASNLHHFGRAALAKAQRNAGRLVIGFHFARALTTLPLEVNLVVRITREAPKPLDDDNLAGACKSLRDGIADALGVDDRDPRVCWLCDQSKSKTPSVLIEVYAMRDTQ